MADPEPPHQRQNFLGGFKLTLEHLGRPPVTRQYPEEKRPKQPRQHGRHVLNRYEDGMEKCIGCELCAGVCPADCIYVRGLDNPPDHPVSPGERYGYVYEINFLRCIHCDLCVEACPTEAITEIEADGVLLHQPQRRHLHQGGAAGRRRRQAQAPARGRTGGRATTCTPRDGCGPRHRRGAPSSRDGSSGRASSGSACARPRAGSPANRDDAATGSKQLRDTLERHLLPSDLPAAKRGPRGAIGRMMEKAERFAPGAGKKHRARRRTPTTPARWWTATASGTKPGTAEPAPLRRSRRRPPARPGSSAP